MDQQQAPKPKTEVSGRRLNHPEMDLIEEAYLIQNDLRGCIDTMQIWYHEYANLPNPDRKQIAIGGALFRDAIVQFIACFDKGAPYYLDEAELYGSDPAKMEGFKWMHNIRTAYAAHRYGAFRQCCVLAFRGFDVDFSGLGPIFNSYRWPQPDEGSQGMIHLMMMALEHIDAKIKTLHDKLFAVVQTLTKEEFENLPIGKAYMLPPEKERISRRDIQRAVVSGQAPTRSPRNSKRPPSDKKPK